MPEMQMDVSQVGSLAQHLRRAGSRVTPELEVLLSRHSQQIAAEARANALRDAKEPRPWLGTTEGVVVETQRLARRIVSPRDPRGQSVGYRIEYGTSTITPRPFLGPAMSKGVQRFNRDALALLVKASL